MQQATQAFVSLKRIRPGINPRKFFDPAHINGLAASMREQGVLQPIVLRPIDNGELELVAGECRCRAAKVAFGDDFEMPSLIKPMTDLQARAAALTENIQRADMSPAEEAVEAAKLVGLYSGDRDEAANILGWTRSTLDRRLALMNCSSDVLEALTFQKIQLGHAELLAALSKENQDRLLPVIVNEKKTVSEIKLVIQQASCVLSAAIFDKADCASCQHNSATQTEMFGESIATGNCTNRTCFTDKTEKQLEAAATQLRDEYPVVRIVRAGDNHTRVQLAVDGAKGVGLEQAKACHACQNYGVAISGLPDSLGKVYRGQCFDTICNMQMVAARLKAEAALEPSGTGAAPGKPSSSKAAGASTKVEANAAPVTVVAESDKVKAYRVALWRKSLRKDIGGNASLAEQYLIGIVLTGHARRIDEGAFRTLFERVTKQKPETADVAKAITAVQGTGSELHSPLMLAVCFSALEGIDVVELKRICKHHKLDLGKHWKLSKDFLELITKSEMMVVADELGIRAALGDEFKKVFNKPKPELIEALLNVPNFDYAGKIPKVLKF